MTHPQRLNDPLCAITLLPPITATLVLAAGAAQPPPPGHKLPAGARRAAGQQCANGGSSLPGAVRMQTRVVCCWQDPAGRQCSTDPDP